MHGIDNEQIDEVQSPTALERFVRLSNAEGKLKTVCAKICPEVKNNWISGRIVRRLSLKTCEIKLLKEAEYNRKRLISTGKAVDLVCSQEPSDSACRHRFLIVEHVPFDMLFGADFL